MCFMHVCLQFFLPVQSTCCCSWRRSLGLGHWPAYLIGRGPGLPELSCPRAVAELDKGL